MSNSPKGEERLVIWTNSNTSRGKASAAAVHAALNWYGINHGAVIVLGAKPKDILKECIETIQDAGRTEVEPGTTTAGIRSHENAPLRLQTLDAIRKDLSRLPGFAAYDEYTAEDVSLEDVMRIVGNYV